MEPSRLDNPPARKFDILRHRAGNFVDSVVFILLLALIVATNVMYGTVDAWWEAAFECALFGIAALWIVETLVRGEWRIRKVSVLLPLVLLVAFAFLQALSWPAWLLPTRLTAQHTITIDRYQTLLTARKALALTVFLALLLVHTSTARRFRWLVRVIIALGLFSAVFGILRQVLQPPDASSGFVLPFLLPGLGYGQYIYHNVFAYLMEMVLGLLAGLLLGGGIPRQKVLTYLAAVFFVLAALVLSLSRGAILGLIAQATFLLFTALRWYSARRTAREDATSNIVWLDTLRNSLLVRGVAIVLIVAVLVIGVFWIGGEKLASRVREFEAHDESAEGLSRTSAWRSTLTLIGQNPWTGVGFGNYFLAIPQYKKGTGLIKLEQAHNDYLDLAANGGVIGFALAAWFALVIIKRTRISFQSKDRYRRAAALGAAAGMFSLVVHTFVDFGLQVTGIAVVFAGLIVICVAEFSVDSSMKRRGRIDLPGSV
jgi:O-antigen ligase